MSVGKVVPFSKVARVMSTLLDRAKLAFAAGMQFGGKRDMYNIFGYKTGTLLATDFMAKYQRQDIAGRIVDAPPAAIWSDPPKLVMSGTRNNTKWDDLAKRTNLWTYLYQTDRLARMNYFSCLLLGFGDGKNLSTPVTKGKDLMYLRALGERQIFIGAYEVDPTKPRFGKPLTYFVTFDDPRVKGTNPAIQPPIAMKNKNLQAVEVHWSRMIHVVDNPLDDEVWGTPILHKVYNLLDDLLKTAGGTAETYWMVANRGLQADIDKEMELDPKDGEDLAQMFEEYQHELRRVIRTRGVNIKELGSHNPDPKNTFEMIMALLSGATGIPQRILIGSEAGQLASEQDRANWSERIAERRKLHSEPYILNPFLQRLVDTEVLPNDVKDHSWEWPEAYILSPLERSTVMATKARAAGNLSRQTGSTSPMQITSREEARNILELQGDLPAGELLQTDAQAQMALQKDAQQAASDLADKQAQAQADAAVNRPATPIPGGPSKQAA